jgi:hypothetical protein
MHAMKAYLGAVWGGKSARYPLNWTWAEIRASLDILEQRENSCPSRNVTTIHYTFSPWPVTARTELFRHPSLHESSSNCIMTRAKC